MTVQMVHKNELFDRVVKMLNVISILLNSKLFFSEVLEQVDLVQHLLRFTFKLEIESQPISQD
jgi:predicted histidine transporter YuiF (NhaC family)